MPDETMTMTLTVEIPREDVAAAATRGAAAAFVAPANVSRFDAPEPGAAYMAIRRQAEDAAARLARSPEWAEKVARLVVERAAAIVVEEADKVLRREAAKALRTAGPDELRRLIGLEVPDAR